MAHKGKKALFRVTVKTGSHSFRTRYANTEKKALSIASQGMEGYKNKSQKAQVLENYDSYTVSRLKKKTNRFNRVKTVGWKGKKKR